MKADSKGVPQIPSYTEQNIKWITASVNVRTLECSLYFAVYFMTATTWFLYNTMLGSPAELDACVWNMCADVPIPYYKLAFGDFCVSGVRHASGEVLNH